MIAFTIPGQPVGKGRPRIGRVGAHTRMFTPTKTAAYEGLVAHAAHTEMARLGRLDLLDGALACAVSIDCQVPASWSQKKQRMALAGDVLPTSKPDTDNVVKAIFDGCNGTLWRDDVLVVDLKVRKRYSSIPCVRVEVWPAIESLSSVKPNGTQGDDA